MGKNVLYRYEIIPWGIHLCILSFVGGPAVTTEEETHGKRSYSRHFPALVQQRPLQSVLITLSEVKLKSRLKLALTLLSRCVI